MPRDETIWFYLKINFQRRAQQAGGTIHEITEKIDCRFVQRTVETSTTARRCFNWNFIGYILWMKERRYSLLRSSHERIFNGLEFTGMTKTKWIYANFFGIVAPLCTGSFATFANDFLKLSKTYAGAVVSWCENYPLIISYNKSGDIDA